MGAAVRSADQKGYNRGVRSLSAERKRDKREWQARGLVLKLEGAVKKGEINRGSVFGGGGEKSKCSVLSRRTDKHCCNRGIAVFIGRTDKQRVSHVVRSG